MIDTQKKKIIGYILLSFFVLVIIASLLLMYFWEEENSEFGADSDFKMANTIEYKGKRYKLRDDVQTLLIAGVDKFEDVPAADSYNNDKCADFLVLLVVDRKARTYSTIYLNRDTITDVTVLGVGGKKVGTVKQQLSLAHTYGSGGEDSARNTARAVSAIFGGLRIDRFMTLTMDAVAVLNDAVGGVTLTIQEDLTAADPSFIQGETVTLRGEQALRFVRARGALEDSSNTSRMERQKLYLDALYGQMIAKFKEDDAFSSDVILDLTKFMSTNCSSGELERMMDAFEVIDRAKSYSLTGEYKMGEYAEFYPNEDSVKEILVHLFYK